MIIQLLIVAFEYSYLDIAALASVRKSVSWAAVKVMARKRAIKDNNGLSGLISVFFIS